MPILLHPPHLTNITFFPTMPTEMDQFPTTMARKPLTEAQKNDIIENLQLEREYQTNDRYSYMAMLTQ